VGQVYGGGFVRADALTIQSAQTYRTQFQQLSTLSG
jgi:hypothetical protein